MLDLQRNPVKPFFCPIRPNPIMFRFGLEASYSIFRRSKLQRNFVSHG